jgi:N-methylhydantoinase A
VADDITADAALERMRGGFEQQHRQMYGHVAPDEPIQITTFRLEAAGRVPKATLEALPPAGPDAADAIAARRAVYLPEAGGFVDCAVYDRERLRPGNRIAGPAIIEQMDATTVLLPGQDATVDPYLNLLIATAAR